MGNNLKLKLEPLVKDTLLIMIIIINIVFISISNFYLLSQELKLFFLCRVKTIRPPKIIIIDPIILTLSGRLLKII